MVNQKLLSLRKHIKQKQPHFIRQDYHKIKCLKRAWRIPTGKHAKIRYGKAGHRYMVTPGYGSPREVYGLCPSGFEGIRVCTVKEVEAVDPETQGIIISSSVGNKKKIEIIKKAQELSIKVINLRDLDELISKINTDFENRKKDRKSKKESRASKKKESEKKKEEKKLDEKISEEEKKEKEKKERDKVLTKKEA